jgi:deoxyribose-phosphate aldolase
MARELYMDKFELLKFVDHTLLKAFATWEDIKVICEEAIEYKTASVCIPPCYIKKIQEEYGEKINICTVIGFPLGYSVTEAKIEECKKALEDGANEIDMVINISDVKNKLYKNVEDEIRIIKKTVGDKILKVIVETCYLTEDEKIEMCHAVTNAGADYIKTSTGFGTGGATMEDVQLFKMHIGPNVKIKASGGIKSVEDMEAFIKAGCSRLGTSSAIKLINDAK